MKNIPCFSSVSVEKEKRNDRPERNLWPCSSDRIDAEEAEDTEFSWM